MLIQFLPQVPCDGSVVLWHLVSPSRDEICFHLERLAFGEQGFSKRRGGGASAEGSAAQGDLGLATGDGGATQCCQAPSTTDGGAAHVEFGLAPLYGGVAQG